MRKFENTNEKLRCMMHGNAGLFKYRFKSADFDRTIEDIIRYIIKV